MPEGDTLHRMAARLQALVGRELSSVSLRERGEVAALAGRTLQGVEARGKHLLFHLEGGHHLRVHLGMRGRMRRVPSAQASRFRFSPLLLCAGPEAVAFIHPAKVELYRGRAEHNRHIERLGPDLLGETLDLDAVVRRARAGGDVTLAELLLDQRVACGLGNVYKSEVLFTCGASPLARVCEVDDATLRALYSTARELMRKNLGPGPRVTVPGPASAPLGSLRHFVYRRAGHPCPRCDTPIVRVRHGRAVRSTYYCPRCQAT